MAGTLTLDTLKTSSGVLATQNGMTGIAKAWASYTYVSGSVPTVRSAFNISSITLNQQGAYTVNFTTAMPDANYGFVATGNQGYSGTGNYLSCIINQYAKTTSGASLLIGYVNSTTGNISLQNYAFDIIVCGN